MAPTSRILASLLSSVIGILVMVVLATLVFLIATLAVSVGSHLAGYDPSGDFVALSAALIVVAVILAGGLTPGMSDPLGGASPNPPDEDPAYD